MTTCPQCHGAIGEAGKAYGYAGPWCACPKVTRVNPDYYIEELAELRSKLSVALGEMNRQRDINKEFNKTLTAKGEENAQLRAQLEAVTKERDEARESLEIRKMMLETIGGALDEANAPTLHPDIGAEQRKPMMPHERVDALKEQRDSARAQRDRAMEIVHADVLIKREHDEYRAIRAEIAKEKEVDA